MPCTRGRTGGARRLSSRPLWECPGDARLVPPAGKPAFESPEPLSGPRPSAGKFLEAHSTEALGGSLQLGATACGPLACVLGSEGVSTLGDSRRRLHWGPAEPPLHKLQSPAPHHHAKPHDDSCLRGGGGFVWPHPLQATCPRRPCQTPPDRHRTTTTPSASQGRPAPPLCPVVLATVASSRPCCLLPCLGPDTLAWGGSTPATRRPLTL